MASQDPASSGTEDSPHDSGSRREITILAVSLGVVGLIAAGVIGFVVGRSGEEAAPGSEPSPAASGSVLSWEAGDTLDIAFVASVVKFGDSYWALGEDVASYESETAAVRAYRSDDGQKWTDLGVVISGGSVSDVTATSDELIAVGSVHEEPLRRPGFGLPRSVPAVWRSADGTSWQRTDLTFSAEPGIDYSATAHATGVNSERAVIFGSASPNVEAAIEAAIPDEYQELLGPDGFGMGMGGPPFSVQIHGPFGITVFSATFEELGIDPDVTGEFFMGPSDAGGLMWTSTDLRSWDISDDFGTEASVNHVVLGPTGEFIAHGYGHRGPMLWTSPDGLVWEPKSAPEGLGKISVFGDRLVATNHTPFGVGELVASSDAETWETITPEDLLDSSRGMWNYGPLSASNLGIVAIAMSYPDEPVAIEMEPPPVVITKGDITMTADDMEGSITLTRGDEVLLRINTWMEQVPEEVAFDVSSRTMTFLDPESGEDLVTLTFDEIRVAQEDTFGQFDLMATSVVVFSADGERWSTQSTVEAFGGDTFFSPVFAFDDLVIATVQVFDEEPAFDPMDFVPPPTQMWVGTHS